MIQCRMRKVEVKVGQLIFPLDAAFSNGFCMDFNILGMDFFEHAAITFDVAGKQIIIARL